MTGTIFLYDDTGNLIRERIYTSVANRSDIIARWRVISGYGYYYHISIGFRPQVRVKNFIPDAKKPPIKRPKPEYSNKKSLYE